MLENLRQAHDAFVSGAPFAALALMRSILEGLLRDHYGAEGKDLSDRINQASKRLPSGASAAALHRLTVAPRVAQACESETRDGTVGHPTDREKPGRLSGIPIPTN